MIGADVLGDDELLERGAVPLEQAGDGGKESDRDDGRERGGGDRRDGAGAG